MQVTWGQIVEVEREQQQLNCGSSSSCGSSSESRIRVKTRRWLGQHGLREVDMCHEHSAGSQTFLSWHKRSNSWHICFVWKISIWGWVSLMDLFNSETNTWVGAIIWWCCVHPWSTNSRWTKSNCERGGQWKRKLRKWRWSCNFGAHDVLNLQVFILRVPLGPDRFWSSQSAFPERNSLLVR